MNRQASKSYLERAQMFLYRLEDGILVGSLAIIIVMAVTQIFLRNLFESGIIWGNALVRILVLWIGLLGAMVASRDGNHICIDAVTRYLPERVQDAVGFVSEMFTAAVCGIMAYYSLQFVKMEFEYGGMGFARIPSWVCEVIIPVAFAVIALRYFTLSLINFKKFVKPTS
ncbi:TRAP transporter small permease [Thermodesulfobacteriota bacterium]